MKNATDIIIAAVGVALMSFVFGVALGYVIGAGS